MKKLEEPVRSQAVQSVGSVPNRTKPIKPKTDLLKFIKPKKLIMKEAEEESKRKRRVFCQSSAAVQICLVIHDSFNIRRLRFFAMLIGFMGRSAICLNRRVSARAFAVLLELNSTKHKK
uniref:Uncharacterized protein n=1 Tax=Manihot esculenta TaxID=3983 RepID=A0A2C9UZN8_MANES